MANALYDAGRENMLGADIDWDAHDIRLVLRRRSRRHHRPGRRQRAG